MRAARRADPESALAARKATLGVTNGMIDVPDPSPTLNARGTARSAVQAGLPITVYNLNAIKLGAVDSVSTFSTTNTRVYNGLEFSLNARLLFPECYDLCG